MTIHIIGNVDSNRQYCTGSFSKQLTTFVCLSHLSETYDLPTILDDDSFFDTLCAPYPEAKAFLALFQQIIGSHFTLRDICSYYTGLPYTFNLSDAELARVEAGEPFKHHSIPDEATFLERCRHHIRTLFPNRSKFHYSEISILFLGYLIEKAGGVTMESLYEKYLLSRYRLTHSLFSRTLPPTAYVQDLSAHYDYPSIAILNHGYFCYSNGFYTTLNDAKILLENFIEDPVFKVMTDLTQARAASGRLLNGLAIEIRRVRDDIIYGYEGLSFSGCNIWAYSTQRKEGFVTTCDSEEEAYTIVYDQQLGYTTFDPVPESSEVDYKHFLANPGMTAIQKDFPAEFQGEYHRVNINDSTLETVFAMDKQSIRIRNPDEVTYPVVYSAGHYAVRGGDKLPNIYVDLYQADSGNHYMLFDGTLYRKIP